MADSLGMFIPPELLQSIHEHDARIRAVMDGPAFQRFGPIYAVLYIGVTPDTPCNQILEGLPWDALHMHQATLASTVIMFTLEHDYIERIWSIDHTHISPKAQMIIYKAPGESEWTTRLLLSRI